MGYYLVQVDPVPGAGSVMVTAQVWKRTTQPTEGELGVVAYAEQVVPWNDLRFSFQARVQVFKVKVSQAVARAAQAAIEILYDNEGVQVHERLDG